MNKLFRLGTVVMTKGISEAITGDILTCLMQRHISGDWGDLCEEDKALNDLAVEKNNDRVFSSYKTDIGTIWVITEWDRSYTTVLFPNEY